MQTYVLPALRDRLNQGETSFKYVAVTLSSFIRCVDEFGASIKPKDPRTDELKPLAANTRKDLSILVKVGLAPDIAENKVFMVELQKILDRLYNEVAKNLL
jgi:mannitol-1-phosphate/altronate dehydrogenase